MFSGDLLWLKWSYLAPSNTEARALGNIIGSLDQTGRERSHMLDIAESA